MNLETTQMTDMGLFEPRKVGPLLGFSSGGTYRRSGDLGEFAEIADQSGARLRWGDKAW